MKLLKGLKSLTPSNSQKLTDIGFIEAFERNWIGESIGRKANGDMEVFGWLLGNLSLQVRGIQNGQVNVEISIKKPETGEKLAIIHDGWIDIGPTVTFQNPPEGAVVIAQRVSTSPNR